MLSRLFSSRLARLLFTTIAIAACLVGIWVTGRAAIAQLLVRSAAAFRSLPAANEAEHYNSRDAEVHYTRAALLRGSGALRESLFAFEQAVVLRPRDYYLWLELGMAREENADPTGALAALNEAVKLAPYYAQPRWQRGNLLLRLHRYDEAFEDLRLAADSNPELTPSLLDLAWGLSQNNMALAQQLAGATSPKLQVAFASYLARRGQAQKAIELFSSLHEIADEDRQEVVKRLIATGSFSEAFQAWQAGRSPQLTKGNIYDGGFEGVLSLEEGGFGWRIPRFVTAVQLSQTAESPHSESKSLQLDFTGESNPASVLLSQLIAVEPERIYELSFAVRSRKLVTGGLPVLKVVDATDQKIVLGSSRAYGGEGEGWTTHKFSFATRLSSTAVVLTLEREGCTTSPCPAFGTLWLDSFGMNAIHEMSCW